MVSSTSSAFSLTVHNTASGHYALTVMTVVAVVLPPFVLAYPSWTYYVFRRRVGRQDFTERSPAAAPRSSPAWNDGRSAGEASDVPRTDRQRS
jgi:hypothetical protein